MGWCLRVSSRKRSPDAGFIDDILVDVVCFVDDIRGMNRIDFLHTRALSMAGTFRKTEGSLVGVLMELDAGNGFLALSYPSCFEYCRVALALSDE